MNDDAIFLIYRVIVHRGQAPSHSPMFAARQRYVEDVVAPPTVQRSRRDQSCKKPAKLRLLPLGRMSLSQESLSALSSRLTVGLRLSALRTSRPSM